MIKKLFLVPFVLFLCLSMVACTSSTTLITSLDVVAGVIDAATVVIHVDGESFNPRSAKPSSAPRRLGRGLGRTRGCEGLPSRGSAGPGSVRVARRLLALRQCGACLARDLSASESGLGSCSAATLARFND